MAHDLAGLEAVGLRLLEARDLRPPRRQAGAPPSRHSNQVRSQPQVPRAGQRPRDTKRKIKDKIEFKKKFIHRNALLQVLQDLAKRCPNLTHLLLDFSQANQLHDFTDLSAFPTKLKFMCLCLSDVIFLDNFMKRIYRYSNYFVISMLQITFSYFWASLHQNVYYLFMF